ncbi:hypothetical protein [Rothia sp. 11273D007AR]
MKKLLSVAATGLVVTTTFVGCGGSNQGSSEPASSEVKTAEASVAPEASSSVDSSNQVFTVSDTEIAKGVKEKYTLSDRNYRISEVSRNEIIAISDDSVKIYGIKNLDTLQDLSIGSISESEEIDPVFFTGVKILGNKAIIEFGYKDLTVDKYNDTGAIYQGYQVIDISTGERIGNPIKSTVRSTQDSKGHVSDLSTSSKIGTQNKWVAGVPGESLVVKSYQMDIKYTLDDQQGNAIIFDNKSNAPKIVDIPGDMQKERFVLSSSGLVEVANTQELIQISSDSYAFEDNTKTYVSSIATESNQVFSNESLEPGLYSVFEGSSNFCEPDSKYSLNTGFQELSESDFICRAIDDSGNMIGEKGVKYMPVIITSTGEVIDLPVDKSDMASYSYFRGDYLVYGDSVYEINL